MRRQYRPTCVCVRHLHRYIICRCKCIYMRAHTFCEMLACLPACLPACLLACLLACWIACILVDPETSTNKQRPSNRPWNLPSVLRSKSLQLPTISKAWPCDVCGQTSRFKVAFMQPCLESFAVRSSKKFVPRMYNEDMQMVEAGRVSGLGCPAPAL